MFFLGLITRCKDEFFIKEFCDYYLSQGVDKIFVIDDNSNDKSIYNNILDNRIEIIYEKNIIKNEYANKLYKQIKSNFKWMIYCDVDEFITTKKNIINTIKDELNTTFKDVDCIKIPWVMMSCNSIEKNPNSILSENTYRWNHNKKHPHKIPKFRCRYDEIEVKCIFKTDKFNSIWDHYPKEISGHISIVDSISKEKQKLNSFYKNLRENEIENGILLCYHYRIISKENSINKLKNNLWYIQNGYTIDDLMSSDYPEIIDETLKNKTINNNITDNVINKKIAVKQNIKIFIIGFNRCGTRTLHYFFKDNNLKSIHWDNNNLVDVFENNIKNGNKLLENGKTINKKVNSNCNYCEANVFSDMTKHIINKDAKDYYKRLDKDYPNSKFILNIRNVDKWIQSRIKHNNGNVLNEQMNFHNCDEKQIEIIWKNMYEKHILDVKDYFENRNSDLCIYDIENDTIDKIIEFLKNDFILNKKFYKHIK